MMYRSLQSSPSSRLKEVAFLTVVMVLYARRVVDWALSNKSDADRVIKALDMTYEQHGRPFVSLGSGLAIW